MNRLNRRDRARILQMLCRGQSILSISRNIGNSKNTIAKLLSCAGKICAEYQNKVLRNLNCERVQIDNIWSFTCAKQKNLDTTEVAPGGLCDVWTWTAIDADSRLIVLWMVSGRDDQHASTIINDLRNRLVNRALLSKDDDKAHLEAIVRSINTDRVSALYAEHQYLTTPTRMGHFTDLSNDISKKIESHAYAVALHIMYYNFVRIHPALNVSPAMAAGVSDKLWVISDIVALIEGRETNGAP